MGGSKAQTVGYKYYLGEHMVLCHGPIDAIKEIKVDKKLAWSGYASDSTITIDQPKFFGGESREGGIGGSIDIAMGKPTQGQNAYLVSQLGALVPGYRGVVSAILKKFYLGMNPYLKPWSFRAQRILTRKEGIAQWYPDVAAIQVGDDAVETLLYNGSFTPTFNAQFGVTIHSNTMNLGSFTDYIEIRAGDYYNPGAPSNTRLDTLIFVGDYGTKEGELLAETFRFPDYNPFGNVIWRGSVSGPMIVKLWDQFIRYDGSISYGFGAVEAIGNFHVIAIRTMFDMNPAHIIRECLTDSDWGMGYQDSDIDEESFTYAANLFWNENIGLSLLWDRSIVIEEFVKEVCRHVDMALYVSRKTGKYVLKPIRSDYDEDTLITLDESNISKVANPSRPTFGELANSVTVTYWDYLTGNDASVTVTDPAMVQMQGQPINSPLQYPGFSNRRNATIAAQRDLKALSSSFLSCTIYANSDAKDLNIGDVFKFTWPRWQINTPIIMRVSGIAFGDGKSNQVRITCSQDIFSTPTAVVVTDPGTAWVDPSSDPDPVIDQMAFEAPYYELAQNFGQTLMDSSLSTNPELGYVMGAAPRPAGAINARFWTDDSSGYVDSGLLDFCPYGLLTSEITPVQTVIATTSTLSYNEIPLGSFVQIGKTNAAMEFCRVDAVDTVTGVVTLGRGCLDTTPKVHPAGTPLFFWDSFSGYDPTEYALGETIDAKITAVTGKGELSLSEATTVSATLAQRAYKPYPPGDFKVNGSNYQTLPINGLLTLTWTDRDRLQQTAGVIYDHTFGNIGPEAGTTYRIQGYIDGVLTTTVEPATTGATWTPVEGLIRIDVDSKRDGIYSFQPNSQEFFWSYTDIRNLDDQNSFRITVDGETRATEN